jgi:hypothetical protein
MVFNFLGKFFSNRERVFKLFSNFQKKSSVLNCFFFLKSPLFFFENRSIIYKKLYKLRQKIMGFFFFFSKLDLTRKGFINLKSQNSDWFFSLMGKKKDLSALSENEKIMNKALKSLYTTEDEDFKI